MALIEQQLNKTHRPGQCITRGCMNKVKGNIKFCGTCRCRNWRIKNPIPYAYNNIKHRAKQRGKEFTITLEYFRRFCYRTKYIKGKGRSAESFTVDRKDESRGYVPGNLQVKTNRDNIRKKFLSYDYLTKQAQVLAKNETVTTDNPF